MVKLFKKRENKMNKLLILILTILALVMSGLVVAEATGRGKTKGEARVDAKSSARNICKNYVTHKDANGWDVPTKAVNIDVDCYKSNSVWWVCKAEYECKAIR
ncbi:MAG: hypothetical protein ACI9UT_001535 [Flavobacteriales bacterium]|jgi:hypothetical protein